ncbi:MAG: AAA family ATPase [Ekhidna sp.]|nr:AAA family ATPase [Ekhidna sp.]
MQGIFEQAIVYPDTDYMERFHDLVGLDDYKERLRRILILLINPDALNKWKSKYHPGAKTAINSVLKRPPLIVFIGDVGSGKSELAITIGDYVAREEKIDITLLPLSLSSRGEGRVGQMTQLISGAFEETYQKASQLKSNGSKSRGAIILLVDEADALAQSRESSQMHHEDKAGVNAFIRGVDRLGNGKVPAAVIMCTNRSNSLDPAIKRRAAEILKFERPNDIQRRKVIETPLKELGFQEDQINQVVKITGVNDKRKYGFTFSDLIQRLIPCVVLQAFPNSKVDPDKAIDFIKDLTPTKPFKEEV